MVKNSPANRETCVPSLGQEDAPEKEIATHSSSLAWKISWTEAPGGYSPWGCEELDIGNNEFPAPSAPRVSPSLAWCLYLR